MPLSENLSQDMPAGEFNKIGFSLTNGAYFVETNGGGSVDIAGGAMLADPTITAFRANAAAAQFSRHVAQQFYGSDDHIYGYLHGGSGGAFRTLGSMENTRGVWDGAVPYVPGTPMAIPNMFTVRVQALRELWDVFPQIIDAMEPGGSGDPYAGLTQRQAAVLHEIDAMGFPMQSWYAYETMGIHGFAALYPGVKMADGGYFADFWSVPGYLGHDHPEYFDRARGCNIRPRWWKRSPSPMRRGWASTPMPALSVRRSGVDNAFEAVLGPEGERVVGYRLAAAPPPVRFHRRRCGDRKRGERGPHHARRADRGRCGDPRICRRCARRQRAGGGHGAGRQFGLSGDGKLSPASGAGGGLCRCGTSFAMPRAHRSIRSGRS